MRTIGEAQINKKKPRSTDISFGAALSPRSSPFAPLLFSGRIHQGFQTAAEAGFHAVELSLRTPEEVNPGELSNLLNTYELTLSAIATGRSYIEDSLSLSSPIAKVRNQAIQRIQGLIQLAAAFKSAVIIGGIRGRLDGTTTEQSQLRDSAIIAIRECARYANEFGVTLFIEPINRYETNFINSSLEGIRLLDQISEPSVKLLLDTFHMNIEEVDLADAIKSTKDRLGYIHFADSNRLAPGQGHIDFARVHQALADIRYRGIVTVEILPLPDDTTAMHQAGLYLRALFDQH